MGKYLKTRYPGIFQYVGPNNTVYGISYYVGGKRHREITGPLFGEAQKKLREKQELGKKGVYIQKKRIFRELIEEYVRLEGDNPSYQKSTKYFLGYWKKSKDGAKQWTDGPLLKYFGDMRLAGITPHEVENYKKERENAPVKGKGETLKNRSVASVNRELEVLRVVLNKAVVWSWLEDNPFAKFKARENRIFEAEDNSRCRFLSPDERTRFLDAVKRSPEYLEDIFKASILTGLRKSDLLKLKWPDVDMEKATITFVEQKKKRRQPQKIVKFINQDMVDLLKNIPVRGEYIFCKKDGSQLKDPKRAFKTALKRAGIKDFKFHDMRHTSATYLLERGATLEAVQKHLNHSDITMTQRYAHIVEEYQRKQVGKLDGIFGELSEVRQKLGRNEENQDTPPTAKA